VRVSPTDALNVWRIKTRDGVSRRDKMSNGCAGCKIRLRCLVEVVRLQECRSVLVEELRSRELVAVGCMWWLRELVAWESLNDCSEAGFSNLLLEFMTNIDCCKKQVTPEAA
jgi:hypothetical protein